MIALDEKNFAARLTQLRMKKGVSARDMSLSIGQNPGYIHNIESGKSMPSLTGFFYICEYLGISPEEFFSRDTEDPGRIKNLVEKLKGLNEHQLQALESIVDEFRK